MARTFERATGKLAEADFFLSKLRDAGPNVFEVQCYLSAYAAAARSVTLAIQVAMSGVPGFQEWYDAVRARLREDPGARWFHALRNASQHQGTWNITAGSWSPSGRITHWAVAEENDAEEVDVLAAAERHQATLADLVRRAATEFPRAADPLWIFDEAHLAAEGLTIEDLEEALGFPRAWTEAAGSIAERLNVLARYS